jgi:hypothetical protein
MFLKCYQPLMFICANEHMYIIKDKNIRKIISSNGNYQIAKIKKNYKGLEIDQVFDALKYEDLVRLAIHGAGSLNVVVRENCLLDLFSEIRVMAKKQKKGIEFRVL